MSHFSVLLTLPIRISERSRCFILSVGNRDNIGRFDDTTGLGLYSWSFTLKEHVSRKYLPSKPPGKGSGYIPPWIYIFSDSENENNGLLTCSGSSPPSKVQYDASTASSQLSNPPPAKQLLAVIMKLRAKLTFNHVSYLQKCDWLRIRQAHSIFKIKWTLSVEIKTLVSCLNNSWKRDLSLQC